MRQLPDLFIGREIYGHQGRASVGADADVLAAAARRTPLFIFSGLNPPLRCTRLQPISNENN